MIYFTLATVCVVVGALAYVGDNIPQAGFTDVPVTQKAPLKSNMYEEYVDTYVAQRDLLSEHNEANP